ncbi:MAG TPA: NAD(P)/FAD-dependent oxidoreductase [Acidimicrobiales bacterium]|nr:NAD(P)/FAD-dependent oxidoreductase [Acidimicrobiales bacterium]
MRAPDAVVVGSGPNGMAAAVTMARAGLLVDVYEGAPTPGGGCRTEDLTLPGFRHDVCAAVHPLATASPFFRTSALDARGVILRTPEVAFAHPLDGGRAAAVTTSVEDTASSLGVDAAPYRTLMAPLVRDLDRILAAVLVPLRSVPAHPLAVARFGVTGLMSAQRIAGRFQTEEAQALLAGAAAHSMLPLSAPLTGSMGLLFTMLAHGVGWPVVEGGSAGIIAALVDELESLGGRVLTDRWVRDLGELPAVRTTLLDVSPRGLIDLAGSRLPVRNRRALERFRYGPGICKVDWALAGPVPWEAEACRRAGTVHVGGTLAEVARSESDVAAGRHPERPYCLVAQPGVVDATRAPSGCQTLWAYCHVPAGSPTDMTSRIESQIERFAPGFRDLVLDRRTTTAVQTEDQNPNYVGGDINGGRATLRQTIFRPTVRWNPYRTGLPGVFLCSASTPPGGGVHGMSGYGAARVALGDLGLSSRSGDGSRHG